MWLSKTSNQGSTLLPILVITTLVLLSLMIWSTSRQSGSSLHSKKVNHLQAIANARSALSLAIKPFEDSAYIPPLLSESDSLLFDDTVSEEASKVVLWEDERLYGTSFYETEASPFSQKIYAYGIVEKDTVLITGEYGGEVVLGDSSVAIGNSGVIQGGSISGELIRFSNPQQAPLTIDQKKVSLVHKNLKQMFSELDSAREGFEEMPTTISTQEELDNLADTIKGSLFFDCPVGKEKITLRNRKICILGDLQVTGSMTLDRGAVEVFGEVRINDNSSLQKIEILSQGRVFFANESSFEGKLVTLGVIEIFNEATILPQSLLIAFGDNKKSTEKKRHLFDISVRENAIVEGSLISLGEKGGGIQTEDEVQSLGLLLSTLPIYHRGEHEGFLQAPSLQNPNDTVGLDTNSKKGEKNASKKAENLLWGRITYSFDEVVLVLPWFLGEASLQSWREE